MGAKGNVAIDVIALVAYLAAANPALTGIGVHEWLGLAVLVVLLVHVALHADWVFETVRGLLSRPLWARMGNFVLDALALVALAVCVVSGLMVSGAVLPSLGWYATGYYFWNPLHAVSAKVLLAFLVLHGAMHGKWFANALGKVAGIWRDGWRGGRADGR